MQTKVIAHGAEGGNSKPLPLNNDGYPTVFDKGRISFVFMSGATQVDPVLTGTETMFTMSRVHWPTVIGSSTSWIIPNGYRMRITSFNTYSHFDGDVILHFSMRYNSAGAVTTASPVLLDSGDGSGGNRTSTFPMPIPDGLELVGDNTAQIGFSWKPTFAGAHTGIFGLTVTGFYYPDF